MELERSSFHGVHVNASPELSSESYTVKDIKLCPIQTLLIPGDGISSREDKPVEKGIDVIGL